MRLLLAQRRKGAEKETRFCVSRRFSRIGLLLLVIMGLVQVITAVPPSPAAAYIPPQQGALDPRFGAIESFWAPAEAAELGVGFERILFYWNEIQPTGPNDWNTLHVHEEWLAEAQAHNRQVLGLLKNTPQWATDGEFASGVPRGLYLPIDDPGNLWANYVRRVAQYYGPLGVHNWIVWNEPDIAPHVYGHEFAGSTEDYYRLVKVTYQVMKQVDPQAKIHIGGMTHWHDTGYLRRFLQVVVNDPEAAENNYFFDALTFHIYFRPETIPGIVGNAFAVQQQLGISPMKQVWINETNARPSLDPEWPVQVQAFHLDLEQQAWYIPQAYALGFYAGASHIGFYKLVDINMNPGDESWGLIRPYDFSKRPAFYAYKHTIQYLAGFQYPIRREQSNTHYLFSFTRPQGVTRIMWARTTTPVDLRVPALAASGVLVDPITGVETPVTPGGGFYNIRLEGQRCRNGECLIGGPPVFLVEAGVAPESIPTSPPPAAAASATATPEGTGAAGAPVAATTAVTGTVSTTSTMTGASLTATDATDVPATETATARPANTPRPTRTPSPTAVPTDTPTVTPTDTATAVPPTSTTEVAALPPPTVIPPVIEETAVAGVIPADQASYWFLGVGLSLGLLLAGVAFWRRR
ncbi:MAG: hypothetical protein HS099_00135 [Ardenticatenaceae bacterium]|nr:hypothetical protein [Ardenticatenaceae bacterium]